MRGGDPCPACGSPLEIARGIEMGHIFQLGTKYSDALGLTVLDQNGKQQTVIMGSYGIGVSRAMAAIAEMYCDERGLVWPRSVAPADVHIVATGKPGDPQLPAANELADTLAAAGVQVLLDDRVGVSPGRQVQRRRPARHPDDRRRRPRPGRRRRRAEGPQVRRARGRPLARSSRLLALSEVPSTDLSRQ